MNLQDIVTCRLRNQQLIRQKFKHPQEVVAHMGAMQAQDYAMARLGISIRLPGFTERQIEAAFNRGEIIRTHVLRPTWHLVASQDIYWMLALTAPQIKTSMRSRHKQLELTPEVVKKSYKIIVKALENEGCVVRETIGEKLTAANIPTNDNRLSHLLACAELDMLICSGSVDGKKQTYALLENRVEKIAIPDRDDCLARLAWRYFDSHGPATLEDFTWWSGLKMTDAKQALEMIRGELTSVDVGDKKYWLSRNVDYIATPYAGVHLLPAFDEYVISYKERGMIINYDDHKRVISRNGIFWPVIIVNGRVAGTWKRTVKPHQVVVEVDLFDDFNKGTNSKLERKIRDLATCFEKEVVVKK